ncbi:Tn3 family transposase [Salmonella enterica subsp. enterica]|nr:Tn3 family transposase [Salmonella enterica subsp. enterica]
MRPLIGGTLNIKHVRAHWDDILRSIKRGTVTASLMLRSSAATAPERTGRDIFASWAGSARCSSGLAAKC